MMRTIYGLWICAFIAVLNASAQDLFPDGTPIPDWFNDKQAIDINLLGRHYRISDYGVTTDSSAVQTEQIQAVINKAHDDGGGVIIIPKGTFLSGSLFFKPGTHLHLEEGAVLKGSDDISHFPLRMTRMEGQTLRYFAALVNADGVDGFSLSGPGTINGNGLRYWKAFWLRREFNPQCTNMDEMRPRLIYISNSNNVRIAGLSLINSPFWTTHLYKCENVRLQNLYIFSPSSPVKAPSADAVDIDACANVHITGCYMSVNDDAVALKGGKGPTADRDPNNGGNRNIIIEDCTYGFCHSALTCGSESIHNRNIIFRRSTVDRAQRLLWLKMRPDTPQRYEYILLEDIAGNAANFLYVHPWTQFFDLKGHPAPLPSRASHIVMRNINLDCSTFLNIEKSDQYELSDFVFENLKIRADKNHPLPAGYIHNLRQANIAIVPARAQVNL
jgi:polygalacturonase